MEFILELIFGTKELALQVVLLLIAQLFFLVLSLYIFDPKKYYFSKFLVSIPALLGFLFSIGETYKWNHEVPNWAHVRIIFSLVFSFFLLIMILVSNINKMNKSDISRTLLLYWLTMAAYFVESIPVFIPFGPKLKKK